MTEYQAKKIEELKIGGWREAGRVFVRSARGDHSYRYVFETDRQRAHISKFSVDFYNIAE
jgi:hypothetical protein